MILRPETIYQKAAKVIKRCETRDSLQIADMLGIYVHPVDGLTELLGMYTYRYKERHILLNSNMDELLTQMVCAHEIGHDILHRQQAKSGMGLQEFTLFDMRSEMEYEANAFAAHLRIRDEDLTELLREGYDVVQISSALEVNVNLTLIKLNEMNRMGWKFDLPYIPKSDFLKHISPGEL